MLRLILAQQNLSYVFSVANVNANVFPLFSRLLNF